MAGDVVKLPIDWERRVIALEYATKLFHYDNPPSVDQFVESASAIEKFIREGKD